VFSILKYVAVIDAEVFGVVGKLNRAYLTALEEKSLKVLESKIRD
jgi:hypothetical protein